MATEYRTAFRLFDKDGNGSISAEELGGVLRAQGVELTADQLAALVKKYDKNGTGIPPVWAVTVAV